MPTIYLAPLEGITTYVYRNALEKHYGGVDKYFTPFLTASHLKGREKRDVHPDNNKGMEVVPQILTNDAELFVTIAKQLAELGYREVNLNLGCPSG
ncbi:MAG: tRNA-dihydrouridine synthase, partial [Eubacterium sp.]|nr:tRNA-dihydrouridine synthase [Eubacterium sp.]